MADMTAIPVQFQHQFPIRHESKTLGKVFEGTFTTKKLSVKELGWVSVRRAQLNGGMYYDEDKPGTGIDEQTDWLNQAIAHCEVSLKQVPTWWNLDELYDIDLLLAVYKKVVEFENSFSSPQPSAAIGHGSSQNDSGGTSTQTGAAGHITAVGRGEVQPSLDP
jgi:hypothetical protein